MTKRDRPVGRILAALRRLARRPAPGAASPTDTPAAFVDAAPRAGAFDESVLEALAALDADGGFLEQLIGLFVGEAGPRREALVDAAERGDALALREAAHAIKGSAVSFGATRLAQLASEIEDLAGAGTVADDGRITATKDALDEAVEFLASWASLPSPDQRPGAPA